MHRTLSFSVERVQDSCLNRHVACVGLRFRFLVMAISMVQSPNTLLPNTIAKWILRERIYFTALDYFTVVSHVPTQTYAELREDIKFVLEFWHKIVAEKKYLKEENFLLTSNSLINTASVVNAGANTPDATSVVGVEGANGNTAGINTALGASATYNSISGLGNNANNAGETQNPAVNPSGVASNNSLLGGGAISQLVANTGIFLEPSMAVASLGNNSQPGGGITRTESSLFTNSNLNQKANMNQNPNVWMNTLSKKSAAGLSLTLPQVGSVGGQAWVIYLI